jgi:hypothetical protein
MHQTGLAVERQEVLVAHDVGHTGVDAPLDFVRQPACDQLVAEFNELLAVDGGLFVRKDEKADIVLGDQLFDFIDNLLGIAHPVIAPKLPLRTKGASERASPGKVRDGDAGAQRNIGVFVPFQDVPVRLDRVEILHGRGRMGRNDLIVFLESNALDRSAVFRPPLLVDCPHQLNDDFLAFAAHDDVHPGRLAQDLLVHEGGVDTAEDPNRMRVLVSRNFQGCVRLRKSTA